MIKQFLKKCTTSHWKRNQDAVTMSHAIIAHSPVPADCIYRVISQNGDRILFERLSTPRPAPKVTVKSNWHPQQQQQQHSLRDDASTSARRLVRESQSGTRDIGGCTTDDQTGTWRLVRDPGPVAEKKPQFEIDLRVEGVSQDAILQDGEKVKEINKNVGKV